jgi:hypothetical protein
VHFVGLYCVIILKYTVQINLRSVRRNALWRTANCLEIGGILELTFSLLKWQESILVKPRNKFPEDNVEDEDREPAGEKEHGRKLKKWERLGVRSRQ